VAEYPAPAFEGKICPPEQALSRVQLLPRPLVFTNGCFDILHAGHVTYLAQARQLGASLLVAVNTDASVRRLAKGEERPINPLRERLAVLAALESVSLLTWFEEDTPMNLILAVKPDVLAKGGDWPVERIVGAAEVLRWGGQVHSIPLLPGYSTTALIKRLRKV
jgi:D-glycero-beta-D-manno-heptose 1-phosphate adenylyltransferase